MSDLNEHLIYLKQLKDRKSHWSPSSDAVVHAIVTAHLDELIALIDDGAKLAANQCLHGISGDERGNAFCPRISELENKLAALESQPVPVEPVATVTHSSVAHGVNIETLARAPRLTVGTKLYAAPPSAWRRVEDGLPEVLFDGYSVFKALSDQAKTRTSAENVSDTLDAVVRLMRNALPEADK